ncbi:hypothetical protein N7448_007200 [Penicillium atrosanguineum]|uniref:DUF1275 domain protein n=1 Tax=Penicillium atrosanguineum TaxID=1132637 RepID=A0A9W9PT46_9EURO|nr:uncharacterized protein N7443_010964 [Penicillium atrosanguineum]KAJ5133042.1 hypothetical protein N7448_007200 [Penicillium atrosanguineum]KAJ5141065.1 hypothetical protein N7526_002060 [Penicillium atrosanguineum]KAJ5290711.1 hypothetical protein N7443_010964 [Penicillium atrosanguineum]KAJ5308533.1 hypothetical protein N7476_009189 [Penicillium atrosanguineum]
MEKTTQPDLEARPSPDKPQSTLTRGWMQNVDTTHADLVCLLLCFLTGLCDSSAYNAWSCFLGMQTGNTIFLGLGASNQPTSKPWGWLKSLISITFFFTGAMIFSTVMRRVGALRRGTLFASFLLQTILIIIAVALIQADLIPHTSKDSSLDGGPLFLELIPIALLAFQSAGAMTCSRSLGFNEIPTVVLTSVYFDIASDPKITDKPNSNVKRNRRIGGVVALLVGAIAGGWLSRSSGGMESALWMAAGLKFVAAFGWLFWKGAAPK